MGGYGKQTVKVLFCVAMTLRRFPQFGVARMKRNVERTRRFDERVQLAIPTRYLDSLHRKTIL